MENVGQRKEEKKKQERSEREKKTLKKERGGGRVKYLKKTREIRIKEIELEDIIINC